MIYRSPPSDIPTQFRQRWSFKSIMGWYHSRNQRGYCTLVPALTKGGQDDWQDGYVADVLRLWSIHPTRNRWRFSFWPFQRSQSNPMPVAILCCGSDCCSHHLAKPRRPKPATNVHSVRRNYLSQGIEQPIETGEPIRQAFELVVRRRSHDERKYGPVYFAPKFWAKCTTTLDRLVCFKA